jgi:hypothetical protein
MTCIDPALSLCAKSQRKKFREKKVSAKKKPGPVPAPEKMRRRHCLTFRVRDGLKELLQIYADENGRSISEEIEFRLELSMVLDDTKNRRRLITPMMQENENRLNR